LFESHVFQSEVDVVEGRHGRDVGCIEGGEGRETVAGETGGRGLRNGSVVQREGRRRVILLVVHAGRSRWQYWYRWN
jgi:hypothetical protein